MNRRLVLALLLPFAACALQWLLWEAYIRPYAWLLFFPAAFFSAWLAGLRGGLASGVIGALLVWYVYIPPSFSFELTNAASVASIVLFVLMSGLFGWFFDRLGEARRQALAASEARFEATFEQAAVGMALVAPDGHWLRVNRKLYDITGYPRDELLTKTFQDITHPDDLDADLAQMRRMLAREIDTYSMEKRYYRKDGTLVWVNLTVSLVWKGDATPDYFISVIEDISARKRAEAALQESEARLREANHLAGLGHWHWDLLADTHTWSAEIYACYGRDPTLPAAVYPEVQRYFTPESWTRLVAAVEEARASGRPYECDAEVVRPDGGRRWITARGRAVRDAEGRVVALHGTLQDITERKLAELELRRRNEELERFDRAAVGREQRMIDLKREVNALARELGRAPPYDLGFVADTGKAEPP